MKKVNAKDIKLPAIRFDRIADDFRNLDPNDPGVWPAVPRYTVMLVLLLVLLAGAWWFLWQGQLDVLETHKADEAKLKEEWLGKKRQAVNIDEYRKQLAEIDRQFGALLKQLPSKSEMEALLVDINQAGRGRGLQFELWKPGAESTKEFYAELPIALRVTGNYDDLGNFASDISKLPRIVTLSDIAVEAGKKDAKSSASGDLVMVANAMTYRYLDEEEVAKQRREKAAQVKK